MSVLSVINHKGGVAKTTTSINLASSWAAAGKKVLLIDMDPQASATHAIFGEREFPSTVYDVLINRATAADSIYFSDNYKIDVLPAEIMLSGVDIQLSAQYGRERILKRAIDLVKRKYDKIIIDCSPSLGLLTVNALMASKDILIPICPEYFSIKGVELILETIESLHSGLGHRINVKGIVITRYRTRKVISGVIENIKEQFNLNVFESYIPDNIAVEEAHHKHLPVKSYAPRSKGALAYDKLAKETLK